MADKTGTDFLREILRARNAKFALANLARDLGISTLLLDAFMHGGQLPVEVKHNLTKTLLNGHAIFDPNSMC